MGNKPGPKPKPRFVRPKDSFTGDTEDGPFVANPRQIFDPSDELVRKYPDMFEPVEVSEQRPLVQSAIAPPEGR